MDKDLNFQPRKFTPEHIRQANQINLSEHLPNREQVWGFTIDNPDTVDRDDGIWLINNDNGTYQLQVSISDVSELIPPNSPLDLEARARVATLYHTSPITPMLPVQISANLGSLQENEPRLALTVFINLNARGEILGSQIKETIFTNLKAFSYEEVEEIFPTKPRLPEERMLKQMQRLTQILGKKRGGKTGILTEEGYLDEDGNLIKENVNTHQLIAELMILTNTIIAEQLSTSLQGALYRTQDVGFQDLFLAQKVMGRPLVRASYAQLPLPHVSLGLPHYCHFTSPIRRLPDLINHRIVKALIKQQESPYSEAELVKISQRINEFYERSRGEMDNYLKQKAQRTISQKFKDLEKIDFEALSQKGFSQLIIYAIKHDWLDEILPEVEKRFNQLQPKDFYYLCFQGKVDIWADNEALNVVSILTIKSQLEGVKLEYQVEYSQRRRQFLAWCYVGKLTTPNPSVDVNKQNAKKQAARHWLKAYFNQELTENPLPVELSELSGKDDPNNELSNWERIQQEFASQQGIAYPLNLSSLNKKRFSKLIESTYLKGCLQELLPEIERRGNKLQPKDFYYLWFKAKINILSDNPHLDYWSIVLIKSQKEGLEIELKIENCEQAKQYFAFCYVDGLTTSTPAIDKNKKKAQKRAAQNWVQAYKRGELTDNPSPIPAPEPNQLPVTDIFQGIRERTRGQNPYRVGEVCQLIAKDDPELQGKGRCWCIVSEVHIGSCTVETFSGEFTVGWENLKSLEFGEEECQRMKLLSTRLTKIREVATDPIVHHTFQFLGQLKNPELTPVQQQLLSYLESIHEVKGL